MATEDFSYLLIATSQRAERAALRDLDPTLRQHVKPLFELHPIKLIYPLDKSKPFPAKSLDEHITHTVQQMAKTGIFTAPFFWDVPSWSFDDSQRCQGDVHPVTKLFNECRDVGLPAVPVITLARDTNFRNAVASVIATDGRGVVVRIKPDAFHAVMTKRALPALLRDLGVMAAGVHLVIDVEHITMTATNRRVEEVLALIQSADVSAGKWRSVTVAAGAFPRSLAGTKPGTIRARRWDWELWWDIYMQSARLPFVPGYGDYAIAPPKDDAFNVNPRQLNPTPRIRYALPGAWVISSGRHLPKKAPAGARAHEYRRAAKQITELKDCDGPTFSPADHQVHGVALGSLSPGNPESWRRHGTSRHAVKVLEQLERVVGL